jgi:hypothetical protein
MEEGMDSKQQPHLILANKLFLLSHPDVDDIDKVRLREEVLSVVKSDGNCIPSVLYFTIITTETRSAVALEVLLLV